MSERARASEAARAAFERERQESDVKERLEEMRRFGDCYRQMIDALNGETEDWPDPSVLCNADALIPIVEAVKQHRQRQEERIQEMNPSVRDLIEPMMDVLDAALSEEEIASMKLEHAAPGMVRISAPLDTFKRLRPGASAMALKDRDAKGISYVLHPVYSDAKNNRREQEENIPHEAHHLAWWWASQEGACDNDEVGAFASRAFKMFQDELMARAVSNGALSGYTHMSLLSPRSREKQRAQHGDEVERVGGVATEINEVLSELQRGILRRETDVTHRHLLQPILVSRTFEELMSKMNRMLTIVKAAPERTLPETDAPPGWGFV